MNTNVLTGITRNLLGAWHLDLEFLVKLVEKNEIDFDEIIEEIECNFWEDQKFNINTIIYQVFYKIATDFITENEKLFPDESHEFEIYTNYMDSHLWFESERIQEKYESLL